MEIEIRDLCKNFDNIRVLNGINLKLSSGLFGLLGANGAGKTTLIKILASLIEKTSGEIIIDGNVVEKQHIIRKMTGYIPQEFSFYPDMTVYEVMDYFCCLSKIKKKDRKEMIAELLNKVNLFEDRGKRTKVLSGGMKRRLGIAVALIGNPEILLVDEPTVGLDPRERMNFRNILVDFAKDKTVLFSTHIVSDIEETCQKLAVMKQGSIIFAGTRGELLEKVEGRVWEDIWDEKKHRDLEKKYIVTGKVIGNEGTKVRVLSDKRPTDSAKQAVPGIRDGYMFVMEEDKYI